MADDANKTKTAGEDSKVFDVAKPGKSAPSTTSKAIIVTNHPVLSDPMVVEDKPTATTDEPASPTNVPPSVSRLKIEPLSKPEDVKPEDEEKPVEDSATEDATTEDTNDDDDVVDRDKIKDASTEEQELIDRKADERQANIEKIALAKTYYLPINQVVRRRSKHVAIAGTVLIVLLGIAWADVALDAGLITIPGVKAPTHFFK